jgi:hypothetical protein
MKSEKVKLGLKGSYGGSSLLKRMWGRERNQNRTNKENE